MTAGHLACKWSRGECSLTAPESSNAKGEVCGLRGSEGASPRSWALQCFYALTHPEERSRGQNLILRPRRSPQEH